MKLSRFLSVLLIIFNLVSASGQSETGNSFQKQTAFSENSDSNLNRLTIYVIPSKVKYDWSSPHTLYKSYIKNAWKNLFSKENYLLGHAFLDLQPADEGERIFTGMRSASRKEQKSLVLKEHYGLAILGCSMSGRLETEEELSCKLKKFAHKGQLAFLEFLISDSATNRLTGFFQAFKDGIECDSLYREAYGGAYYPRYKGEGAGCSAFVISFLDLAGLLLDEFDEWLVKIDIPISLIGGPYNNCNEVHLKDIKKVKSWADVSESGPGTYEHLEIYDPTLMYEWINSVADNHGIHGEVSSRPVQQEKANGLLIDSRNRPLPEIESIFMERDKPSLFINYQEVR